MRNNKPSDKYQEWQDDRVKILCLFQPFVKSGRTSLLHVPYFGSEPAVKKYVQLLLSWTHTGGIPLDRKILINNEVVQAITGLPEDEQDVSKA